MKFKIELTKEELSVVDKALQQMPYFLAAPIIQIINIQIQEAFNKKIDDREDHATDDLRDFERMPR